MNPSNTPTLVLHSWQLLFVTDVSEHSVYDLEVVGSVAVHTFFSSPASVLTFKVLLLLQISS